MYATIFHIEMTHGFSDQRMKIGVAVYALNSHRFTANVFCLSALEVLETLSGVHKNKAFS
jgi:hypothetical protein